MPPRPQLAAAAAAAACLAAGAAAAPLRLSRTLSDNAVLQRDAVSPPAVVWGFADAGVTVAATLDGAALPGPPAVAGADGVWRVALPPTPAGGPHAIALAASDGSKAAMANVLFGDVHFCSGQSNVGFVVAQGLNASAEIAAADAFPNVRLFTVGQGTTADAPLLDLATVFAAWTEAGNASVSGADWTTFSAVCWFFGRDLYLALGGSVPIGLISSNWGGTPLIAWSSAEALAQCGTPPPPPTALASASAALASAAPAASAAAPPAAAGSPYTASELFNAMVSPFATGPTAMAGAIWWQGEADAPPCQ